MLYSLTNQEPGKYMRESSQAGLFAYGDAESTEIDA